MRGRPKARGWQVAVASAALGMAAAAGSSLAGGCSSPCERSQTCPPEASGATGGGGVPSTCVPSESGAPVDDACGVFVAAAGDDGAEGTKAAPLGTLGAAIARARENGTGRVYACAETFEVEAAVEMPAGVTLYGGLDCAKGWAYAGAGGGESDGARTTLTARAGVIPLVMRGGEGVARIEDVAVVAKGIDAGDPEKRGLSSIAAVADAVAVELVRCALEAGDAAPGQDGAAHAEAAQRGGDGSAGNAACSADIVVPANAPVNACGAPEDPSDDSFGGSGGVGFQSSGGAGSPGGPGDVTNGGAGEFAAACMPGTAGDNGADGEPGAGAQGLGEIAASGYTGVAGNGGAPGTTAQGGGGGGGAKGGVAAGQCTAGSAGGASGGSGGAGGCGGAGGRGGGAGGSSIALVSLDATLLFEDVTIATGRGGDGGAGGPGQDGGAAGAGGPGGGVPEDAAGLRPGCAGGPGGTGGRGGIGGGGLGGHALGIAHVGAAPPTDGVTFAVGEAGAGGVGADEEHSGAPGLKADAMAFAQGERR
ncbi:PGRS family protein [Sorangium sp. So ce1335]|uniref:PGRS family protein n=1 Tax=Sorangium sp. So ce1335 TaxID=3133335 RepID=UPI003F5DF65D